MEQDRAAGPDNPASAAYQRCDGPEILELAAELRALADDRL